MRGISFAFFYLLAFYSRAQTLTTGQLSGQVYTLQTIYTAVPFLLITPDARAGALGETGASGIGDAFSIYWNPAKPALYSYKGEVGVACTPWLSSLVPGILLTDVSGYFRMKYNLIIGGGLRYADEGTLSFVNITGNTSNKFNPYELAGSIFAARQLGANFSTGMAVKYIYSDLSHGFTNGNYVTHAGQAVATDISLFHSKLFFAGLKTLQRSFGLVVSNIGSRISYSNTGTKEFLPCNLRMGETLKIWINDKNSISLAADLNKLLVPSPVAYTNLPGPGSSVNNTPVNGMLSSFTDAPGGFKEEVHEITLGSGLEYSFNNTLIVRSGIFYEDRSKGGRQYFTAGFGMVYKAVRLDLSGLFPFSQVSPLRKTFRLTFSLNIVRLPPPVTPDSDPID